MLVVVSVMPYLNSLKGSFHFDDEWDIVANDSIRSWDGISQRPLPRWGTFVTYYLNYRIHGLDFMPGWHIGNILLHAACVLTLYGTLRLILGRRKDGYAAAPLIAALLLAVHPLASEPVNYIRARAVIIYTIFTLAALSGCVIAHRSTSWPRRVMGGLLLVAAVALAALTKEVAGFFALAAPAMYLAVFLGPKLIRSKRFWIVCGAAAGLAAAGGWFWVRYSGTMTLTKNLIRHPLAGHHFWAMTTVYWRYVSLALWPLPSRLSVDHYVAYYPSRVYSFGDGDVLLATAGILVLIAVVIWLARKRPAVGLFLAMLLVGIMPYFVITTIDILVEYKFYLPLTAFCTLAGMCLARFTRGRPRVALLSVGVLCLGLAAATAVRNMAWRTELSLWQDAAAKGPRKARTINVLAWTLATDKVSADPRRALELARRSFDPRHVDPWWYYDPHMVDTLAEAHYANGMYDRAIEIEEDLVRRGLGPVDFFRQQLEKFRQAREASEP